MSLSVNGSDVADVPPAAGLLVVGLLELVQHGEVLAVRRDQLVEAVTVPVRFVPQQPGLDLQSGHVLQPIEEGHAGLGVGGGRDIVRHLGPQPHGPGCRVR